jgi:hypothetical protein
MEMLKINNISKENSKLLFLTSILLLATLGFVIILPMVLANKLEIRKADYPFVLNYISSNYNYVEHQQVEIIENTLKKAGYNYDKTTFEMLNINNEGKYVIKNSEFNKVAKKLNIRSVKLNKDETLIVPRFDNKRYKKNISKFNDFEIGLYNLKVKGIADGKILPKGIGIWIVVVNDNLYSQLETDDGNIKYYVNGYKYDNWEFSVSLNEKIQSKLEKISINNYERRQVYDSLLSLPKIYEDSAKINYKWILIDNLVGVLLFICSWRFLYFKLFTDFIIDKLKYKNLLNLGLPYTKTTKSLNIRVKSRISIHTS